MDYKVRQILRMTLAFMGGFCLGQLYYNNLLKQIPFPYHCGGAVSLILSGILGVGNALSIQMRCISLLTIPMFCGKPGRSVLKAILLTYIIAGPITNMGMNAREVVRVFACSTQLSYNLTAEKYSILLDPLRKAALGASSEVEEVKDAFRSMNEVVEPIRLEIEDRSEVERYRNENDFIDNLYSNTLRSEKIERKFPTASNSSDCVTYYRKKLQYRCENQLSRAVAVCIREFSEAYNECCDIVTPPHDAFMICWPLMLTKMCHLIQGLEQKNVTCDSANQVPLAFEDIYFSFLRVKKEFVEYSKNVHIKYIPQAHQCEVQNAKETSERVLHAFEEKAIIMHYAITIIDICMALLFLRIFNAAVSYHDAYLTNIDYDNVYVTDYFKKLDWRRKALGKYALLPLKKMERNKYIDTSSLSYKATLRNKLITQVLKVMLEVVTATTFVMLDRLFYESLDVVRRHAELQAEQQPTRDLEIEVEGTGFLAASLRLLLIDLGSRNHSHQVTNAACLPQPRLMPYAFYLKIYGGYLGILLLLFANPYTLRLRRTICSYFYLRREKQRILHFYNDILKKRMKMHKTLRRKAAQAVRAHYLAGNGDSLLSMRMKFPQILGWLRVLPAARMACLICGEVEPRTEALSSAQGTWYSCFTSKCPFIYCAECWREAGARCLACEPSLAELSDVDSLTEDERPAN